MKRCEQAVANTAALLQPLQRAADAASTRQRVVKAATLVVKKTLAEYKTLITMLQQTPEEEFERDDFPQLRQQLEEVSIKTQMKMVTGCLSAASTEMLKTLQTSEIDEKQSDVVDSLYDQGQLLMTISEEILSALDSRKKLHDPSTAIRDYTHILSEKNCMLDADNRLEDLNRRMEKIKMLAS